MTTHTKHDHGTFSWTDLSTSDPDAAKRFYTTLFGWKTQDLPAGPDMVYTMCKRGEHDACAITLISKEQKAMGVPTHWNVYVTVDDVDARTKKAEAAGGKVFMQPFDVMDVGRISVIADPSGAALCLWQAKKHIGAQVSHEPNTIEWAELMTNNVDACGKFYANVLDWKPEAMSMVPGMTYTVFKAGETPTTGMTSLPPNMQNVPPNWMVYFNVENTDAIVKKCGELGGKTLAPAMDLPTVGRFAILQDPQGGVFGIIQPAAR